LQRFKHLSKRRISKEGIYNRRSVGTYEMILYFIDSDGNESNRDAIGGHGNGYITVAKFRK